MTVAGAGAAMAGDAASESEKRMVVSINVLFMVSARLSINWSRGRATADGDVFPLAELVAHDPYFEEQRRGIDPAPDVVEIRRADRRRTVDDFEQAAFELVKHARHGALAGIDSVLPIQTARVEEIFGPRLLGRNV